MKNEKPKSMTVPNHEALAAVLGVHRRTLADYIKAGCPAKKTKHGYPIAPAISWFGRTLMRRQIREYIRVTPMPPSVEENLTQILDDHEAAWPGHLERKHSA